jgi:hypothetical protein
MKFRGCVNNHCGGDVNMSFKFFSNKGVLAIVLSSLALVLSVVIIGFWIFHSKDYAKSDISTFNQNTDINQVFVIDRLEEEYAVCEDQEGRMFNYKITNLPKGIKEGDVINKVGGNYIINKKGTNLREKRIEETADKLWN